MYIVQHINTHDLELEGSAAMTYLGIGEDSIQLCINK